MQITGLHRNIYRLSSYALSWEKREQQRKRYEKPVRLWQTLKASRVLDAVCQETIGISRSTFYQYKAQLNRIDQGLCLPSRKPKQVRKPSWGEAEKQLVLRLRRANPTYGKAKIAVLLKRDHGLALSERTVGRILKHLTLKGLIQLSLSAPRQKRKRRFNGHAQPWTYGMKGHHPGQMIQIDHMTLTKNKVPVKALPSLGSLL